MLVYRLQKTKFAQTREDILSGEGARLYGGRWNNKGFPLIYTSATPELAHSEFMIHLNRLPPPTCNLVILEIPDESIFIFPPEKLPPTWRSYESYEQTQQITKTWLKEKQSLVAQVPSAIVPMSHNYLINPLHPFLKKVTIVHTDLFPFDERFMLKSKTNFMGNLFDDLFNET